MYAHFLQAFQMMVLLQELAGVKHLYSSSNAYCSSDLEWPPKAHMLKFGPWVAPLRGGETSER